MSADAPEIFIFYLLIFVFFGAVLGSFSSAVIHRVKNRESWIFSSGRKPARSKCPHCNHVLSVKDLIPVISWIFQKGRCRYCDADISSTYLFLEIAAIFFAVVIYWFFGFTIEGFILLCALPFVLAQSVLFFRDKVICRQLFCIIAGVAVFYGVIQLV